MRTALIIFAVFALAFSLARTVDAAWSGGSSTCRTTLTLTNNGTGGITQSISCGGTCYSAALGHGSCRVMHSQVATIDHDNNPQTPPIEMDVYICGCRFPNPMPEGGYIDVYDQVDVGGGTFMMQCDAAGLTPKGSGGPGAGGGVVNLAICTGFCPPPGGDCTLDNPPPPAVPFGQPYSSTCSCP